MQKISTHINEGSSAGIELTLSDSAGVAVVSGAISAITWSLYDADGTVINDREDVTATPANPVTIELGPDDTLITVSTDIRSVSVSWTYTDSALGVGTVKTDQYDITIDRVRGK